ncbi:MAG: protoporphyrinogen oxidase, partial [Planctomycetes bacterium]|nr:protoporphyrinogen oxidase [Planctomycetota bacterium]
MASCPARPRTPWPPSSTRCCVAPGNRASPRDRGEVVVLGGGLAGIAATAALVDAGVDVLLLEAGDALGGKLRATSGGVPRGPLVWEARRASVTRLVERLGLAGAVVPASPASNARYVVRDGALCALRPDLRSLWSTRALSWRDRLMLATEPLRMALGARRGGRADADDESVAAFFRRHFGAAVADRLVAAMVGGIWAGDPELLSLHSCFPDVAALAQTHGSVVKGLLQRQRALAAAARVTRALPPSASSLPPSGSLTLRGGLASIGAAAAATLPVRTGATVTAVAVDGGQGVRLTLQDGSVVQARAVVVATEAPVAARLLAPVDAALSSSLAGIAYAPLAVVHWREDSPGSARLPAGFGWLAPPRERTFSLGTLFVTDLAGGAYDDDGRRRFAGFVGGVLAPQRAALDEFALARGLADELRALTGGAFGAVLHVERQPHAVAQPTLGHRERVARLRALTADGALVLAGSYLGAGAMRCAVEAGVEAAAAAVARLPALSPSAWATTSSPLSTAPAVDAVEDVVAPSPSWLPPAEAPSSPNVVPLVVVGASYRTVSTELRARLAACEPSTALLSAAPMASPLPPFAS